MDIKDLLPQPCTEEQLKEFLCAKQSCIKEYLDKQWAEFVNEVSATPIIHEKDSLSPEEVLEETPKEELENMVEEAKADASNDEAANIAVDNAANNVSKTEAKMGKEDIVRLQFKNIHLSLPNGKVNKEYVYVLPDELTSNKDYELMIEGLERIGLSYQPEQRSIVGIPTNAGDHRLLIKAKLFDWTEDKPVLEKSITLIINPDPRSLWNNIPTDRNTKYYKEDSDLLYIKVEHPSEPRKDMVAASQRGRSHAHEGKARDDEFKIVYDEEQEWYILTVADGAGSAPYSRKGSAITCQTVVEHCLSSLKTTTQKIESSAKCYREDKTDVNRKAIGDLLYTSIGNAVFNAYKNIKLEADKEGNQIKDYATTLLVAIVKRFEFGWFVGSFWVGDGGLGLFDSHQPSIRILGEPDGGEFAGQTRFLTMSEIIQPTELYKRLRFDIVDDFTALILMSDGITDPKFETDANLKRIEKWQELWNDLNTQVELTDNNEAAAAQLLNWLDFWSPGNHDDRTIAILY